MNKKFYGTLLLGTLLLGSTIVSCKDYDDDIDNLQNQITQLATKADMQSEVSKLQSAVATAQAAAENKAAAAEQAAKDAAAKAQAAADAAAKAQGTADAAATVEALNKVAADAAAAAKAAEDAKAAAEAKAAELEAQLAELQALAATLVSTTDFEAAKKELNDKYAELAAKIGETTGTTGLTGLQVIKPAKIAVGYGIWDGVHAGAQAAEWNGPKKDEVAKLSKGDYVSAFGANEIQIAVNPTDVDVTNTEFAVVNQFGEIAPVAFGTPEVLTRANAAGTYKVKIASAALTSDVVKEFGKNFKKGTEGANATLVAGKIASTLTKDFVAVEKNENASFSGFGANVNYDEISGSVEVVADDAEYVYDSYITGLKDVSNHDSLVWNLKYDGMTLTYNAEAAKKFAVGGKEFKVKVKQINLNGYIHEIVDTVIFKAKDVVIDKVEFEANARVRTHAVQVNVKHPTTDVDLQVETLTEAQILEALGIQKGSDAYIHLTHSSIAVKVDNSFYFNDDNDVKKFGNAAASASLKTADKFSDITLKFVANYPEANFKKDGKDFILNGEALYIPVVITATDDADLGNKTVYTYTVNVPVKFQKPDVSSLFTWKDGIKKMTTAGGTVLNIKDYFEPKSGVKIEYANKQKPDTTFTDNTKANISGILPKLSVNIDLNSIEGYKKLKQKIEDVVIGIGAPTGDNAIEVFGTNVFDGVSGNVKKEDKTAAKAILDSLYMNNIDVKESTPAHSHLATWNNTNKWVFEWTEATANYNTYHATDDWDGFVVGGLIDEPYSYTISGLKAKAIGREFDIPALTVNVTKAPAPATVTMTIAGENAKLYADHGFELRLADAKYKPTTEGLHKGTYELKDKYGDALNIRAVNGTEFNITSIKKADGTTIANETSNPTAGGVMTIKSENYTSKAGDTTVNRNGLVFNVTSAGESVLNEAGKYSITVKLPVVHLTDSADAGGTMTEFTFELEILEKIN